MIEMRRRLAFFLSLALMAGFCACTAERTAWLPAAKAPRQTEAPARWSLTGEEADGVMVTYSTEHGFIEAETAPYPDAEVSGPLGLSWFWTCPVVEGVPGAAAINQAAQKYNDKYMDYIRRGGEAWGIPEEERIDNGRWPPPQAMERQVGVWRADQTVVDLVYMDYAYNYGGAHGYNRVWTAVFDAQTGRPLTLADLSDDEAALRQFAEAYLLELSKTEFPEEIFFDGYEENIPKIVENGLWGFTGKGLLFMANPYELASYGAGYQRFIIPYEDLKGHVDDKWLLAAGHRPLTPPDVPEVELMEAPPEDVLFAAPYPLDGETRWAVFTLDSPAYEVQAYVISNESEIAWQAGKKLFWRGKVEAGGRFAVELPYPIEETNYGYTTGLHLTYTTRQGERRTYVVEQNAAGDPVLTEAYGPYLA